MARKLLKKVRKASSKDIDESAVAKASRKAVEDEDLLGGSDEEAPSGIGSDSESGEAAGALEDESEAPEQAYDEPAEDDAEPADDDGAGLSSAAKVLAKLSTGDKGDLNALKQRIADDSTLLGSWRKAKELGEKRTRAEVFSTLVGNCSTYFGYSEELAEYFLQMFAPETAIKFFEANEQPRPLTVRANSLKARRSSLMQALQARKVTCDPIGDWTKVGLKIYQSAVPVGATPEYLAGQYMIQSASSFIPVMALAPQQNETVLDMAAAPGGKTTYIGQLMRNTGTLFANDMKKDRCKALVANIHRMGLTNSVVVNADGRKLKEMLPKLDRVLLDAPCTGVGIIARDPSVKVKRGNKDFEEHSKVQKELLMAAIDMVDATSKTGGYIVYSTCSVAVEENESVVDHALRVRNVECVSFESAVNFGVEGMSKYRERRFHPSLRNSRRYYPHVHNMDGFFVAKLKKLSNDVPDRIKKDRSRMGNDEVWGEEHWTKDMMDSVVDFDESGNIATGTVVKKDGLNKRDRKRLKRQEQLRVRGISASGLGGGVATDVAKKVGDESKPRVQGAKLGKKRARAENAKATVEAPPQKKLKKKGGATQVEDKPKTQTAEASDSVGAAPSEENGSKKKLKVAGTRQKVMKKKKKTA
eukprot:TRINITY_DN60903_c0_g1_i1.p1 TRINITY_DN60903_c0_g1~~TRINITY_DN60903_c0_g1_i1.p1  ORF type:complete len:663 (+),score=175.48 TRINITY_DN60903_c0_g1_i1:62-1990(+)